MIQKYEERNWFKLISLTQVSAILVNYFVLMSIFENKVLTIIFDEKLAQLMFEKLIAIEMFNFQLASFSVFYFVINKNEDSTFSNNFLDYSCYLKSLFIVYFCFQLTLKFALNRSHKCLDVS